MRKIVPLKGGLSCRDRNAARLTLEPAKCPFACNRRYFLALWHLAPHQRALFLIQRSYWLMRHTKKTGIRVIARSLGLAQK